MKDYVGWLDRDGHFYSCNWGKHEQFAQDMGYSGCLCESRGWCHVSNDDVHCRKWKSIEQLHWLHEHGYDNINY